MNFHVEALSLELTSYFQNNTPTVAFFLPNAQIVAALRFLIRRGFCFIAPVNVAKVACFGNTVPGRLPLDQLLLTGEVIHRRLLTYEWGLAIIEESKDRCNA